MSMKAEAQRAQVVSDRIGPDDPRYAALVGRGFNKRIRGEARLRSSRSQHRRGDRRGSGRRARGPSGCGTRRRPLPRGLRRRPRRPSDRHPRVCRKPQSHSWCSVSRGPWNDMSATSVLEAGGFRRRRGANSDATPEQLQLSTPTGSGALTRHRCIPPQGASPIATSRLPIIT